MRSIAAFVSRNASISSSFVPARKRSTNCARRASIISARRYSTRPRFIGAAVAQLAKAARAATTASRKSLRDARAMLALSSVPAPTTSLRPDSERTNSPLTYNLYVFLTSRRTGSRVFGT